MKNMSVQVTFRFDVSFRNDGKHVLACCPSLDLMTQGRDRDHALHNIKEAASLFVESCIERGTIDEVLRACGWTQVHAVEGVQDHRDTIEVPFELLANDQNNARRLAHSC